ncbi:cell wall hydrolase [Sphingomonas sp. BIUV-7]|uniref:Cell wall hydrolase n=1 Tax=Sphingomonas natans TaxID=3063330 RepID=A0ABT8Y8P2_9SPHN|nr:cell wall hydrolase [Sphingomonas sp. BIUV-7]MDO6414685.1 cell wall hydrolase [Sphingomonas sp. BIUV-7]
MSAVTKRSGRTAAAVFVLLGTLMLVTIVGLCIYVVASAPTGQSSAKRPGVPHRLPGRGAPLSLAEPPPVEPLEFAEMSADQARAFNATVPFAPGRVVPAAPFRYGGDPVDKARATACLAAAVLFEAGDQAVGEAAVAQVVLNRLRHPAFPKSVCGVVFQGSERRTGCQFTFTCDGALARTPAPAAWARARFIAERALGGYVVKAVGTATHYHADYVVPYWGSSLSKIAMVAPHIFYRWPGRWGSPSGFAGVAPGGEIVDRRVAAFAGIEPGIAGLPPMDDDGPLPPTAPLQTLAIAGVPESALKGSLVRLKDEEGGQFVLQLDPGAYPGSYAIVGFTICNGKPNCIVMGWTSADQVPRTFPILPDALRSLAFLYRRSSIVDSAQPFWDCRRFQRPVASQCLPGTGN